MAEVVPALLGADDAVVAGSFQLLHPVALSLFAGVTGVSAIGLLWLSAFSFFQYKIREELRCMATVALFAGALFLGVLSWQSFWRPGMTIQDIATSWALMLPLWVMALATWALILRVWYIMDTADQAKRLAEYAERAERDMQYEDITPRESDQQ